MEEEEEDYISYGTPIPDIEDEAVIKKKAARELQVRDEKGRQRFHGAFTGGFSAGYFNTVSTKEGWAPSSFISSRNKVADRLQQNPEDFMDEEDFGEFGIATRKIHTTSNFQDLSDNTRKRKFVNVDTVIPGEAPLKDIVKPVSESIGIRILQKLGWKLGQGIGPRVKKYNAGKVYGCSSFPDTVILEDDDPMALEFTFAPEDTEALFYKPKDDYFGLGYTGLSKESVLSSRIDEFAPTTTKSWLAKDKRKLTISGQAFGVGAFEDDDEDIYSKDDMSQYDFTEISIKGSENSSKKNDRLCSSSNSVLEGFCLASHPPLVKKYFPPPTLPPDFKPLHQKVINLTQKETQNKSHHNFSAKERSLILGEKFSCSQPLNDNKKIEKIVPNQDTSVLSISVKPGSSFQPFPNDVAKQQRYEEYVKLKNSGEIEKLRQPPSLTEWEKQQEIEEFARAAVLFKPLSFALSSRFESRSHLSVEHEVMSALEKIKKAQSEKPLNIKKKRIGTSNRKTVEWHPASLLCKRFNIPNPYPNSCADGVPKARNRNFLFDQLSFTDQSNKQVQEVSTTVFPTNLKNEGNDYSKDCEMKGHEDNVISSNVTPVQIQEASHLKERPPIDLFKDIFENTSSEEDETTESQTPELKEPSSLLSTSVSNQETESSSLSLAPSISGTNNPDKLSTETKMPVTVKKAGFGVFANIDLDALNKQTPKVSVQSKCETMGSTFTETSNITDNTTANCNNLISSKTLVSNDLYGPELPPNYSVASPSNDVSIISKKHVKHKSKHKHKHHKHKSNKKKKKKSSKKQSDDSYSSDEDKDIPATLIIEKFKELQKQMM